MKIVLKFNFLLIIVLSSITLIFNLGCKVESKELSAVKNIQLQATPPPNKNEAVEIGVISTNSTNQNSNDAPNIIVSTGYDPPNQGNVIGSFEMMPFLVEKFEQSFFSQPLPNFYIEYTKDSQITKVNLPQKAYPVLKEFWYHTLKTFYENRAVCSKSLESEKKIDKYIKHTNDAIKTKTELQKITIKTPYTKRKIGYREADEIINYIRKIVVLEIIKEAEKFRDDHGLCEN